MDLTRRTFGTGVTAGLIGSAGCLGFVRGDDALEYEAVGAHPSNEALSETGYRHRSTEIEPLKEAVEIGSQTREVELKNVVVECDKGVDLGVVGTVRAAMFVAFATPQFELVGQSFHPGDRISPRRIATELGSNYDEFSVGEEREEWQLSVFDEEVDVSTFEGRAAISGTEIDVHAYIGSATNDDDLVIFVGAHPRQLRGERGNVTTLAESLTTIE